VNFNVNFNALLSKYIVHPLVEIKKNLFIEYVYIHKITYAELSLSFRLLAAVCHCWSHPANRG